MGYLKGSYVRPVYKKLLIMAFVLYVIASCWLMTDLCTRLGELEHHLLHESVPAARP